MIRWTNSKNVPETLTRLIPKSQISKMIKIFQSLKFQRENRWTSNKNIPDTLARLIPGRVTCAQSVCARCNLQPGLYFNYDFNLHLFGLHWTLVQSKGNDELCISLEDKLNSMHNLFDPYNATSSKIAAKVFFHFIFILWEYRLNCLFWIKRFLCTL